MRYVQGTREGYTENGHFSYDANSSKPICFYIGKLLLGCSDGAAVITPYDLSSSGQPASLQSGYNISRLLISLDESSEPEIVLPNTTENVMGSINFGLSDGEFAADAVVNDLIERYAPAGSLVSRQDVDTHIADNADVQLAIDNLQDNLDSHIASIQIQWNSSLTEAGVLAHIEAKPLDQNQRSEHLYLELDAGDSGLYLARLVHVDANKKYTYVTLNEDGYPFKVSNNGRIYAYINMLDTTFESIIATSSYQPKRGGYLIGDGGLSDSEETTYLSEQKAVEILAAIARLSTGEFDKDDLLRIASHGASYIRGVACSKSSSDCSTHLEDALLLAGVDSVYKNQILGWEPTELSTKLCLPLSTVTESENCSYAPNLEEFNVALSQKLESYAGTKNVDIFVPYSIVQFVKMREWVGDIAVEYEFYCTGDYFLYQFSDDAFYLGSRPGFGACQRYENDLIPWLQEPAFKCAVPPYYNNWLDSCGDYLELHEWPDFENKFGLAFEIMNRLFVNGVGQRVKYFGRFNGGLVYYDKDTYQFAPDTPEGYGLKWFDSLSVNVTSEEYFVTGVVEDWIWAYSPHPIGTVVGKGIDGFSTLGAEFRSALTYSDRNGTQIMLDMAGGGYIPL